MENQNMGFLHNLKSIHRIVSVILMSIRGTDIRSNLKPTTINFQRILINVYKISEKSIRTNTQGLRPIHNH